MKIEDFSNHFCVSFNESNDNLMFLKISKSKPNQYIKNRINIIQIKLDLEESH